MKKNIIVLFFFIIICLNPFLNAETSHRKTEIRRELLENKKNQITRIKLGIIIAGDIEESTHRNFKAEAQAALQLLNDKDIEALENDDLKYSAYMGKASIYARLLKPEENSYYLQLANNSPSKKLPKSGFGRDIEMPYYIDLGYMKTDSQKILFPYAGIGLTKSAFSSMLSGNAGCKFFQQNLNINTKIVTALLPDFSCYDYQYAESYLFNEISWDWEGHVFALELSGGKKLYAREANDYYALKSEVFTSFGIDEKLKTELLLFTNGLDKVSAKGDFRFRQIPEEEFASWDLSVGLPFSFDKVNYEFGFLPRAYYSGLIGANSGINIGKRHFVYENAIAAGSDSPDSSYYHFYEKAIALDAVFRLFAFPLSAPADRIYIGLNASTGLGWDNGRTTTDFLYAGSLSVGFDLHDNIPFEMRFGMDQDKNLFVYMTVVNRIRHSF